MSKPLNGLEVQDSASDLEELAFDENTFLMQKDL